MIVKTISCTYGRKVNIGDYNSANVEVTYWADVEPEEDLHESMKALWTMAKANVRAQVVPLMTKQTAKVEEAFLGLPVEVRKEMEDCHPSSD